MAILSQQLIATAPENNPANHEQISCTWQQLKLPDLLENQVLIQSHFSGVNYKDALAVTGKGKILRRLPLTPGIDVSGTIIATRSPLYKEGDEVLITGCGLGETFNGGYSTHVIAPAEYIIRKPNNLSLKECMILGTAGFTAGLALLQFKLNQLTPAHGPILVTGASGAVGSLAILLLKAHGFEVEAWSRKESASQHLKRLGANNVIDPNTIDFKSKALESTHWGGCIENIGGAYLEHILPRIQMHGSVACIGLALSPKITTTVFPFILRGINLLGISSTNCPLEKREQVWSLLSSSAVNWSLALKNIISPEEIIKHATNQLAGNTSGRSIVDFCEED